ncbi:hypothetical protein IKJ53_06610, partial [bacterium]|nr:hypothetical protein [bacterium]
SSSQARLLNLTTRMHQIEYKAAKLEAEKLQMANESAHAYEEYLDALEATKVQLKKLNTDGSVTYCDIDDYQDFLNAGYAFQYEGVVYDGTTNNNTFDDLCSNAFGAIAPPGSKSQVITNLINSGDVTIVQKRKGGFFPQPTDTDFGDYETSVAINTGLREVQDESLLRKAEAQYEANMKKIDMKDRKFDQDLAALDAERNAVSSEMETLKKVANDNVDRTFKIFS